MKMILFVCLCISYSIAQTVAITSSKDTVILLKNGTYKKLSLAFEPHEKFVSLRSHKFYNQKTKKFIDIIDTFNLKWNNSFNQFCLVSKSDTLLFIGEKYKIGAVTTDSTGSIGEYLGNGLWYKYPQDKDSLTKYLRKKYNF